MGMKVIDWVFISLLIVGGIEHGLVAIANWSLVNAIFMGFANWVKIAVGISALGSIARFTFWK